MTCTATSPRSILPAVVNPATGATVNPTYQYTYDAYGQMTSSTDALGRLTNYTYDPFGDMLTETLPLSQKESWTYNSVGELASFTDLDGNVTDYTYDVLGRVTQETVYASTNLSTPYDTVTYAYNTNYNSSGDYYNTVTDSLAGTTDYEYDVNGNLIQITSPQGTINYTYNEATGLETGISTSNTTIQYAYDQAGELISVTVTALGGVTLSAPFATTYTYDPDGDLISTQNANGTTETRSYNSVNELTSIVDNGPSGVIASFAYTYDPAGHVLTETDLNDTTYTYTYDALYRVTQETISGIGTLTWTYDLVGNRVASTIRRARRPAVSDISYNANDELTSLTGSSNYAQTYTYDADGNTLTVTGAGGASSATYTWDPLGRMIGASTGGNTISYTYNASGDRTSETVNGQTTTFLNDPNQAYDQVLEEYAPGGVSL